MRSRPLLVEATTHGRVLVRDATVEPAPAGVLLAFHGYAQSAEVMLKDLDGIAGLEAWTVASVQGLHRFYTRGDERVVASWMTREDRELAIADNIAYVDRVVDVLVAEQPAPKLVFAGFSQGAAMAYRAALRGRHRAAAIIALGGDIPPDVELAGAPPILVGAGKADTWYRTRLAADRARLEASGTRHEVVEFAGGHEWTDEFRHAVAAWLSAI